MYRTHIQCADVGRAAWPKPATLSARDLNGELGASTTQMDSMAVASARTTMAQRITSTVRTAKCGG